MSQDPDAVLAALERVIARSARAFARPLAPAITSMSIALRELQDDAPTVDQEVSVRVYMPFNADNNGASYRRVEAEFHNLQPEEMEDFVRLVDGVRAERGDDGGLERDEQNRARHDNHKGEAAKVTELRKIAGDQDIKLTQARAHIAELERVVRQRDDEREDDEEKTSKLENLQKLLDEANVELFKEQARNAELKEDLATYRKILEMGDDYDAAEGTGARDLDGVEDEASISDHANDPELSAEEPELPEKPAPRGSTKKPASNRPSFTPMPRPIAKGKGGKNEDKSRPAEQSTKDTQPSKGPNRITKGKAAKAEDDLEPNPIRNLSKDVPGQKRFGGLWGKGFVTQSTESGPPKHAWPDTDPDSAWKKGHKKSNAGEAPTPGSSRRQSRSAAKAAQSTNDNVSKADDESAVDAEEPQKHIPKTKRRAESSDEEEQPKTSKKPRNTKNLQPVEEESDNENTHVHAARGSTSSSRPKTKSSHTKQNAKPKVVQTDPAESEGGMSDPISISCGEETDSDTDEED